MYDYELGNKLIRELEQMDSNEVASHLSDLGITGRLGSSYSCPIASLLTQRLGINNSAGGEVSVDAHHVSIVDFEDETDIGFKYDTHSNGGIYNFVVSFDGGHFPGLVSD